jgi:hypothetical protein
MSEPKLCPFFFSDMNDRWVTGCRYVSEARVMPERIKEDMGNGVGVCLKDKCAMWRETETIVQEQYIMVNRQVSPEIIRTDRYCGLAGKP